jgi:carboxypeptidase family protein/TonB-dependent receptor-like protein
MKGHWLEPAIHIGSVLAILGLFEAARCIPLQGQSSDSPARGTYVLRGIVVDKNETPLASAELTISRDGQSVAVVRASEEGGFSFDSPRSGPIEVTTRRLGYKAQTITLDLDRRGDAEILRIVLETLPSEVAAVVVKGGGSRLDLFYQHRKENAFGRFIDRDEIEKSRVRLTSDLFRTVPGASLRASRRYGNLIRLRGCQPVVWIDRVPVRDVELDEVVTPEEVAGIEIYSSSSTTPPQFMDRSGRGCGAIVVWTRIN